MEHELLSGVPRASVTVMIISDEAESARIWAFGLKQAGYEVCLAGFSEKTLRIWADEFPDIIVLEDLNSQLDVFEFCSTLRAEATVPVLLLTSRSSEEYILKAYQAGADECIPPPVSPRLFLAKIRAWLRRAQVVPSAALDEVRAGEFRLNSDRHQVVIPGGSEIKLTNLESRLLYLLMAHPGWVLETDYLVDRVWGRFGQGDSVLLKNVIYRLRKKIEPDPGQPRYLLTESTLGYKFLPEGDSPPSAGRSSENQVSGPVGPAGGKPNQAVRAVQASAWEDQRIPAGRLPVNLPAFTPRHTSQLRPDIAFRHD
ncbi:MAG TPA: response regulator transcription factor [Anaerolineales bacterium]|jgi:two-component system response regulator RegX3|nr:response regulator transcription factor [Anaerolineales bacterium]